MSAPSRLRAGVAAVDITADVHESSDDPLFARIDAARPHDRLFVKALVLSDAETTIALVTVDAVAIAAIGTIPDDFLETVRGALQADPGIDPAAVIVNASHCHGLVCGDVAQRTVRAVREAAARMEPVRAGVGVGHEDRIMENRRLRRSDGSEADVRRAYSLPPDEEIEAVGPVDPRIGVLRLDAAHGRTVAAVYHFACHPIQGVPDGGNTADLAGFASRMIETHLGDGATAFFLQGCGADINPILYRDIDRPPNAGPLGHKLGESTVEALDTIACNSEGPLRVLRETIRLPRADLASRIAQMETEQAELLASLRPTPLNLKSFIPLLIRHRLSPEMPSFDAHLYLQEAALGRDGLRRLDAENRQHLADYTANIHAMEQLTRLQVNLDLLRMHQERNEADGTGWVEAEMVGLQIGEFVLLTFPGELPVEIGQRLRDASPFAHTQVSGVTNGYLFYTPTARQLENRGGAQEDSDCLVDAAWEALFEEKARDLLARLDTADTVDGAEA